MNPIDDIDVTAAKRVDIGERFKLEFAARAFNLFNHSNFGSYQTVVNVASYGSPAQNTDLAYAPRMLQFAGRLEF